MPVIIYSRVILLVHLVYSLIRNDWRNITVYQGSVRPHAVDIFEGTPVTAYCGSSSPVNWTFIPVFSVVPKQISNRHVKDYNQITLFHLLENDTGLYICWGTTRITSFQKFIAIYV